MDKNIKLLIIEDEKPLRELLHAELTRSGYQVHTAADGAEGLVSYSEECFSVVLLDVKLPEIGGVEVLQKMREISDVPEIIMFTGHGDIETAVKCIKIGAYDYLTKPVKLDELELVINKAHDKNRLHRENINLRIQLNKHDNNKIVGNSTAIKDVLKTAQRWGGTDEHVLIYGESGTGKELVARAVNDSSSRFDKPFVTVNCGRLNINTAESELFGHIQGAFTGANKARAGLFELADNGTLFMDEISEMPLDVQVKLLRVLETGEFRRLGGNKDIRVDVRFIFAANRQLKECVDNGDFREDLYYRINLLPIALPALRERKEDLLAITKHFIKINDDHFGTTWEITDSAIAALEAHDWPGNIRELKNIIRRACILASEPVLSLDLLPFVQSDTTPVIEKIRDPLSPLWLIEQEHIALVLAKVEGNKSQAARILGVDRKTLYSKLEKYDLEAD